MDVSEGHGGCSARRHPADQPERLQASHELFDQIIDTLEDAWVKGAHNDEAEVAELIDLTTATRNRFDKKCSKVEDPAWKTCALVLNTISVQELMEEGWQLRM